MSPTTQSTMTLPHNLPFDVSPVIDMRGKLLVNPKGDWLTMPTRRRDGKLKAGPRPAGDITHISVHHSGVDGGTMEGHARYHVSKGYGSIAYHIYIKDGQIHQCNDLLALTWHTGNNNHHTIGIAVEGDFTKRSLPDRDRQALYAAILGVMQAFNIPVGNVRGHKEYTGDTACPGFDMNRVRTDLVSIIEQMQYNTSPSKQREEIFASVNRINDLYNKFVNKDGKFSEGIQREAERKLSILYPALKENKFI